MDNLKKIKEVAAAFAAPLRAPVVQQHKADTEEEATEFTPLPDLAALAHCWQRSDQDPVVLFLHDPGCPISARAYRQMARLGGKVPLVDVRDAQQLTHSIEARTGIRHESPQVLILRNGKATWSASHRAITTDAVRTALQQV